MALGFMDSNDNTGAIPGASSVVQGATAGLAAANDAHQWAANQASLDIQRTHVQNQIDQLNQQKKEFDVKVGDQYFNQMVNIAKLPSGDVKNAQMKDLMLHAQQAGYALSPSMLASLDDDAFTPKWSALKEGMTGVKVSNPEAYDEAMSQFTSMMGIPATMEMFDKGIQGASMLNAVAMRNQGAMERTQATNATSLEKTGMQVGMQGQRLDAANAKAGQATYDKAVQPIQFALDGALRAKKLIEQASDPNVPEEKRVALTKAIRTVLANEEARLVTGKPNFGEGTAGNMQVDTFAAKAKDFVSRIDEDPKDTLSPQNAKQMLNFYDELSAAYMQAHDGLAQSKLGGSLPAQQKAIMGRAKAFQAQYGKRFGEWKGPGVEMPGEENAGAQPSAGSQNGTGSGAPSSGGVPNAPATPAAPPTPAPLNPLLMQKAGLIFQKYKEALKVDPAKAEKILAGMKENFPDNIRQALGIK